MTEPAPQPYAAVAMQLTARSIEGAGDDAAARAAILTHIGEIEGQIRASRIFIEQYGGRPVRLAVLPEYLFTSYPGRISVPDFAARAGFAVDGPEYEALGGVAQRLGLFIAANAYEVDTHFPGLYFQASVLVAPSGDVVLRYRRLLSMFAPSPHDVWSRYLDIYGLGGVFPVADTAPSAHARSRIWPMSCRPTRPAFRALPCRSPARTETARSSIPRVGSSRNRATGRHSPPLPTSILPPCVRCGGPRR